MQNVCPARDALHTDAVSPKVIKCVYYMCSIISYCKINFVDNSNVYQYMFDATSYSAHLYVTLLNWQKLSTVDAYDAFFVE